MSEQACVCVYAVDVTVNALSAVNCLRSVSLHTGLGVVEGNTPHHAHSHALQQPGWWPTQQWL